MVEARDEPIKARRVQPWEVCDHICLLDAEHTERGDPHFYGYENPGPRMTLVYREVRDERERAHSKHGATSMESFDDDDMNRLAILVEEVGEVAKEFNEARHDDRPVDLAKLRKELIQTAAMALAWADAIPADGNDA